MSLRKLRSVAEKQGMMMLCREAEAVNEDRKPTKLTAGPLLSGRTIIVKWRGLEVSCLPLQSLQGEYKKSQYFNTSPLCKDYASVPPVVVLLGSWGEGGGGEEEKRLKEGNR